MGLIFNYSAWNGLIMLLIAHEMCAISAHIECYCAIKEPKSMINGPPIALRKSAIIAPNGAKISSFELKYANLPFWVKWVFLLDLPLKSLFWAQNELKWDKYRLFGHILGLFLIIFVILLLKIDKLKFDNIFAYELEKVIILSPYKDMMGRFVAIVVKFLRHR